MQRLRALVLRVPGRRLMGQSFFYLGTNMLAAFGPLILIPYLTQVLTPESYGIYGNFMAAIGVVTVLLGLNMELVVRRHGHDAPASLKRWVGTGLTILLLMSGIGLVTLPISHSWLADVSGIPGKYILLVGMAGMLTSVTNMVAHIATMREELKTYGLLRLSAVALFVGGSIGLYELGRGVVGDVMLARTLSLLVVAGAGLWWLKRQGILSLCPDRSKMRYALRYGVLLVPALFFDASMTFLDRLTLTAGSGGLADAGHYALAYQLAQPLQLVASSMGVALFPAMVRWFDAGTSASRKRLIGAGGAMVGVLGSVWLVYVAGLPWVMSWLGESYAPAAPLVLPLALCFVIGGTSTIVANRYFHSGQTWWISFCCLLGLGVNILGNLVAVTPEGVVHVTVGGYLVTGILLMMGLFWKEGKRIHHA